MTLAEYLRTLTPDTRAEFAKKLECSVGYLYLVAGGHRNASGKLARRIEEETDAVVTKQALRPDIFGAAPELREGAA